MSVFRKATRLHAKLRLALIGPAGSGKTWTSLALASELARLIRESGLGAGRIAMIDSESGSAELYANRFEFDTLNLDRHSPADYVKSIEAAEAESYDIGILDSLSHAWIGKDGALAQVDQYVERGAANSFSAWRHVTPKHNQLVDKMLSCKMHLITTIRAKTEYVQEKNAQGKTEIRKLGLAAIQRDGLEYEFTLVGDLDLTNTLRISKTRLDGVVMPGDVYERPGAEFARKIFGWLQDGAPAPTPAPKPVVEDRSDPLAQMIDAGRAALDSIPNEPSPVLSELDRLFADYLAAIAKAPTLVELDKIATGPSKPEPRTEKHKQATAAYLARRESLQQQAKAESKAAS